MPRGHNGLIWLAAKGALAFLLFKHIVAVSFAIQLLAASRDDSPPELLSTCHVSFDLFIRTEDGVTSLRLSVGTLITLDRCVMVRRQLDVNF